ncbi:MULTISPECIES: AraC family transcriptional regulator [Stenotrophomonas]|uniref:AraC family transcriptional regulator n=1 Tax=Stenotrophomonas hibiscicola TaxID=86189 RepID=A0ABV0CB39_9GAMM|nr:MULTISPECIES: AraC family transcriptional regulator [Stenotrophomonas]MCM2523137.1 AraC family transcriptional regulator [Stenotrophomonas maltophilia]MDH1195374.1 AraC family transcriptional regulator [Stenotrophomonas sp. GD03958]MDQ7313386.1 AraC family transcriptional regulator [Stenotrophomonas sp. Sm10]MDT3556817.1 AraC family transcriptional regulator [Stenotrophomonas maltophilia group sp. msm1]QGL89133.1 helix-turn-helix transcriptional regulator [Stenotrophomonas maltophilia]
MSRYFTFADYRHFGERHGYDYRIEGSELRDDQWAGRGDVHEQSLRGGLGLIASDVHNRFTYTATAVHGAGLTIRLMLQGEVDVQFPRRKGFTLRAGTGMTTSHHEPVSMAGLHPGGSHLRGVSLSVPADLDVDMLRLPALQRVLHSPLQCRHWAIPHALLPTLAQLFDSPWQDDIDALWREGVALQVLAVGLQAEDMQTEHVRTLRAGQRERLERVRAYLHDDPSHAHSLIELAQLACMSPSSLRRHFAQQYGSSVFDYLHEQRMRHAEQGLREDGWTVEQAAAACGYRHPSNFAAAFRKRFGLVPSRWRTGPSKVD